MHTCPNPRNPQLSLPFALHIAPAPAPAPALACKCSVWNLSIYLFQVDQGFQRPERPNLSIYPLASEHTHAHAHTRTQMQTHSRLPQATGLCRAGAGAYFYETVSFRNGQADPEARRRHRELPLRRAEKRRSRSCAVLIDRWHKLMRRGLPSTSKRTGRPRRPGSLSWQEMGSYTSQPLTAGLVR